MIDCVICKEDAIIFPDLFRKNIIIYSCKKCNKIYYVEDESNYNKEIQRVKDYNKQKVINEVV